LEVEREIKAENLQVEQRKEKSKKKKTRNQKAKKNYNYKFLTKSNESVSIINSPKYHLM